MDKSIQIGPITVRLPSANDKSFSIFHDLAELFHTEFQSEAVQLLKCKLRDIKPKPSLDSEADNTSIRTQNVETMLAVVHALIQISAEVGNGAVDTDGAVLRSTFNLAKKQRPKPKLWDTGDVFSIPLGDGTFSLGQVLWKASCTCVLYKFRGDTGSITLNDWKQLTPISILHLSTGDMLNEGEWPVLFRAPVELDPSGGRGGRYLAVGSTSYGGCGVMTDLARVYWGLDPWNVMYYEDYYDGKLLPGVDRPPTAWVLSQEERTAYRISNK